MNENNASYSWISTASERLKSAVKLAEKLHEGQVDKLGIPYIVHVQDVADRVSDRGEDYIIVGLLHDSVEDTDISLESIEEKFGKIVRWCRWNDKKKWGRLF